ncbi:putative addiction module killer protein [Yersinia mollaretii]|nr:putative addiction module killer protein [Yersinia mollaretii]
MFMKTIKHYLTPEGRDLYMEYLKSLRDSIAKAKISSRVNRIASGNFGDHKPCREGVWELRIDQGPGYRVYYSLVDGEVVLLLLGGDKRSQNADIDQAIVCLKDYLTR